MNEGLMDYLIAILMGFIEGLTEYLPVSSTGHLLLLGHFLGFDAQNKTFEIAIQLGAVLAMLSIYGKKFTEIALKLPHSLEARRFVISILIAFLPAMGLGFLLHKIIKTILFESPHLICTTLIIGGIALWFVDKKAPKAELNDAFSIPYKTALIIGLFQCFALIPGMSRSGSTLIGALLFKVEKKDAAEFSFFLAMPTKMAAVSYDLLKSAPDLNGNDLGLIGVGLATAFVTALFVIKPLLAFVGKHGYGIFALWRIIVGVLGLILLSLGVGAA
jgi:undecaprenyl-diphosphatase